MLLRLQLSIYQAYLVNFRVYRSMQFEHRIVCVSVEKVDRFHSKMDKLVALKDVGSERHTDEAQKLVVVAPCRQDHRHL